MRANDPYVALAWMAVVLFGFQVWVNNLQTLPSDFFPSTAVGSVFGLGGAAAALASVLFTLGTGRVVDAFGYTPVFLVVRRPRPAWVWSSPCCWPDGSASVTIAPKGTDHMTRSTIAAAMLFLSVTTAALRAGNRPQPSTSCSRTRWRSSRSWSECIRAYSSRKRVSRRFASARAGRHRAEWTKVDREPRGDEGGAAARPRTAGTALAEQRRIRDRRSRARLRGRSQA